MRRLLVAAMVLCLATTAFAQGGKGNVVEVPFLFTEDQAEPQSDLSKAIPPSDALRTDPYLNAPMTRLEYFLTRMETTLNDETQIGATRQLLREGFDRSQVLPDSIRGFARYTEALGRVVVGYNIGGMGGLSPTSHAGNLQNPAVLA